jgi:hypothetical protein
MQGIKVKRNVTLNRIGGEGSCNQSQCFLDGAMVRIIEGSLAWLGITE